VGASTQDEKRDTVFENLKSALTRIDADCVDLNRDVLECLDREISEGKDVQDEARSFLDGLIAHLIQYPEPIFALLRRVKPILLIKNFALGTRFEDVQEVLAQLHRGAERGRSFWGYRRTLRIAS
jgi:hypothetical protein